MDNFDKILKEKVEQFEVPYNEAHWAEMEGKLNKIRATKIKNTILSVAAGVVTIGVAGYFAFSSPTESNPETTTNSPNTATLSENNTITDNTIEVSTSNEEASQIKGEYSSENNNSVQSEEEQKVALENEDKNIDLIKVNPSENNIEKTIIENHEEKDEILPLENKISADFIVYNNKVCVGEEVSFESFEVDAPVSYLWNFGDGTISNKTNPIHVYSESSDFTVTLTLIDRQTGKEYTTIQRDIVKILPKPNTYFTYIEESKKHDDNKLQYPYTHFKIKNVEDKTNYKWNFGNDNVAQSNSPKTIYQKAGNYVVTLTAENSFGCVTTVEKRVKIKTGINLYAPTAFSPNQDGNNEIFIPKAIEEWDIPFEMVITDKIGNTVYKTSDKNEGWNGKTNNSGQFLPQGIYFWQVVITDAYNTKHSYQGKVNLIR